MYRKVSHIPTTFVPLPVGLPDPHHYQAANDFLQMANKAATHSISTGNGCVGSMFQGDNVCKGM